MTPRRVTIDPALGPAPPSLGGPSDGPAPEAGERRLNFRTLMTSLEEVLVTAEGPWPTFNVFKASRAPKACQSHSD